MKAIEQYFHVVGFTMLYKVVSNFQVCEWNPSKWPFEQYFHGVVFTEP